MEKTILNFHFDYLHPSLSFEICYDHGDKTLVEFSVFLFKVGSTTWHQHFVSLANPGMHAELEKHERDEQESTLIKITSKHGTYVQRWNLSLPSLPAAV